MQENKIEHPRDKWKSSICSIKIEIEIKCFHILLPFGEQWTAQGALLELSLQWEINVL